MNQALTCVRARGGRAVLVGNARYNEHLELDPWEFNQGKRLLGTWGGDNRAEEDFPRYFRLIESGQFDPELLLSRTYSLAEVNRALDDLEAGLEIRPLIDMSMQ
jgi:S-(hydroxymethyl)glutathione dehydrogenase/alcohol dehydrogenase